MRESGHYRPSARTCRECGGTMEHWSDPGAGSYGLACLVCKLFWQFTPEGFARSTPLDRAFFPRSHRGIPAYRAAVGWVAP